MKFSKLLVQPPHHLVLVHIIKSSHSFEQVAIALVHSCNYVHVCGYYCHVAQNVLYSSLCYSLTPQKSHYGKYKMVDLVVINCQAYFLHISIRLINLPWIVQVNLDFNYCNEETIDQPMTNQFSEIAQRYISWTFNWKAYIDRGQHKSYKFWQWSFSFLFSPLCPYFIFLFYFTMTL